ncbi:glycosyltransferase family 2 protein [Deltaproteobacteria bacterium OttesenSCG-928-M10]|nr:glycosyltransferase family 2 protein [Deltaproteobacteria bacterium OttesenSCG-928-M10]
MDPASPLISVIIPAFNREAVVGRAVNSVLAQDYPHFELIVVDDGSTDNTGALLAPLAESGRLKYFKQANRGVSAARNRGLREAGGRFIAFLDSDDEWLPGKLSAQAAYFQENPGSLIVQTQERWIRNGRRVNPKFKHLKKAGDIFLESVELCLISPSAVMLRRELLDEVGLFDEELAAAEDYDLWLRVLARHPAGLIDRELVIRYGGHDDQLSAGPGLDRFRVMALEKILREPLSRERRLAVEKEMARRRAIYENGRLRRLKEKRPESL